MPKYKIDTTKFISLTQKWITPKSTPKKCHNVCSMYSVRNIKKPQNLTSFKNIQFRKQYSIKNDEDSGKQSCNKFIKFENETSVLEFGFNI